MIIDSKENKEKILQEFLKNAAFDGWNQKNLEKSFENCDLKKNQIPLIFENSLISLTDFYIEIYNQKSLEEFQKKHEISKLKIRDKIRYFLYFRFEVEKNNKIQIQRLLNYLFDLKNLKNFENGLKSSSLSLKEVAIISDFMWKNIGDNSTDFNFYTKRLTLSRIIVKTLKVFLKDESADFAKTKKVIDDEIEKVMKFEKFKSKYKKFHCGLAKNLKELLLDEEGGINSPKKIIKKLPFFRLIKF